MSLGETVETVPQPNTRINRETKAQRLAWLRQVGKKVASRCTISSKDSLSRLAPFLRHLAPYITIARPDHWFKNIFILPGFIFGIILFPHWPGFWKLVAACISVCLAASANYTINEYLDAPFDRLHPMKCHRPAAQGLIRLPFLLMEYFFLAGCAILLGFAINSLFGALVVFLLFMGLIYNVSPLRAKDRAWLDVIVESVNNPIRLLLGFSIVITNGLPPSCFILGYWAAGAYLMTLKRFAEIRKLKDPDVIRAYRKSLAGYTEKTLLSAAIFYAMVSSLFLGIFLIKYKVEMLLLFPFLALLFSWYFNISLAPDSVVQTPEKLYKRKYFIAYVFFLCLLFCALCFVNIPEFEVFVSPIKFR